MFSQGFITLCFQSTNMDKLYFSCELAQCGKTLISIFLQFSASIKKNFGFEEDWVLGYNSM